MVFCVAYGCTNGSKMVNANGERIGSFRFPQEPIMRDLWTRAVGRKDWSPTEDSRLCSEHFSRDQINATYPSRLVLKDGAIPNIFSKKTVSEKSPSPSPKPKRHKKKTPIKKDQSSKARKVLAEEDPFHIQDYMVVEVTQVGNPEENPATICVVDEKNLPSESFIEYSKKDQERLEEDCDSESNKSDCCEHPNEDHCPLYPTADGCAHCYYLKKEISGYRRQSKRFKGEIDRLRKENDRLRKASKNPVPECSNCDAVWKENECLKMRLKLNDLISGAKKQEKR